MAISHTATDRLLPDRFYIEIVIVESEKMVRATLEALQ